MDRESTTAVRRRTLAPPPPGYLRKPEAAALLGIGVRQLEVLTWRGEIAAYRPGPSTVFYPVAELERWRDSKTGRAGEEPKRRRRRVR